ncbi:MAG TPA: ABC transporter permease [Thermoanaerobaculia bacterium]|nr:ABC transporter permease [Thermoanaerobaculia bacterium]
MRGLLEDLRFAHRRMLKTPLVTLVIVLSLGLGIGANSAIFTLLNTLFSRPLELGDTSGVVALYSREADNPSLLPVSYPNYLDYRRAGRPFATLTAYRPLTVWMAAGSEPEKVTGELVSADYFASLGLRAALGRTIVPGEDEPPGRHAVVVLSHGLWQRRFAADPAVVGRTVRLNGHPFTVVGVAPPGFKGLDTLSSPQLWVPIGMRGQVLRGPMRQAFEARDGLVLAAVGRLQPGMTLEQAEEIANALSAEMEREHPEENRGMRLKLIPLEQANLRPEVRQAFLLGGGLLMGVTGFLLLIACANVANLLLAQALARRREISLRFSLGARRSRVVRQLLTEGAMLALLGGGMGLLLASWAGDLLWAWKPPFIPDVLDPGVDGQVFAFTLAVSLITGVLFSLTPALESSRLDLASVLRDSRPDRLFSGFSLRNALAVAQVMLAFVLLVSSGLLLSSLRSLQRSDPGFKTENLLLMTIDLSPRGHGEASGRDFYRQLVARIESIPGVRSVSMASQVLLTRGGPLQTVSSAERQAVSSEGVMARTNTVLPGYFGTMGIPLLSGRDFGPADREGSIRVVVVNETLAELLWPEQNPVGRTLRLPEIEGPIQVVGVAKTSKYVSLGEEPQPYLYLPLAHSYSPEMTLHVRTEGEPERLVDTVRRELRSLDPALPVADGQTMPAILEQSLWAPRAGARLLGLFALLALLIAMLGIYGVMAYMVQHRQREIGIRLAIGADRATIVRWVLQRGLLLVGTGIGLGLLISLALSPLLSKLLFEVSPLDPLVLGTVASVLLLVAVTANLVPARRAASVEPLEVIRLG